MNLRFRPTVWPGAPVPPPPVPRSPLKASGPWLVENPAQREVVELPVEVYAREFGEVDVSDAGALVRLAELGRPAPMVDWERHLDVGATSTEQYVEWLWRFAAARDLPAFEATEIKSGRYHLAEVAFRVWSVQVCTDHVVRHLAGEPTAPAWAGKGKTEEWAWHEFQRVTGAALRDFHVRVRLTEDEQPWTTTYAVAMLQLVNDFGAGVPYQVCASETCEQVFLRQRGRSEYGISRMSGVLYCSNGCARAQYQREKRRRDRAASKGDERKP